MPPQNDKKTQTTGAKLDQRWMEILDIVCENIAPDWKTLATELRVSKSDMDKIVKENSGAQERCWAMVRKWYMASGKRTMDADFLNALSKARHKRMSDIVHKLLYCQGSIDEVLGPHMDREERMRESFYVLAEGVSDKWREVAKRLGLTPRDIGDIEQRFPGRPREKCMEALYKWRLLVSLQEFKVGSLIQAVKESGLRNVAADLTPYAGSADVPPPARKKRKGEAILHVGCEYIDMIDTAHSQHPDKVKMPDRPKRAMSKSSMKDYALSKMFFRLLDALDEQDRTETHPLVHYFYTINKAYMSEISRKGVYVVVQCACRDDVYELYRLSQSEELSAIFTKSLVTDEILREIGAVKISLSVDILESELLTVRGDSEAGSVQMSQRSARSVLL